ncbi:MAG: 16S rRNA (cytosine(1402)-N(4))-methyltransferase RsmH [Candidatus Omnitrophica bacterium]|jgi:16S rRNA (cytosine1402-N4)-methyltransferase|nr:16S rRNA (cytosine(1402)-N(4))-methyltransferase RsmH [Candidatus Omnitrophota bacterium]MDD5078782.1 16S rRNA (cytosine(1402)-N(4))-methyltransferase RsmH [Candidatus Omnitrophota bacterium]
MEQEIHKPVMLMEVLEYLNPKPGQIIVDATLGMGGHSNRILQEISPEGRLIGIDRDQESIRLAQERIAALGQANAQFVYGNFSDIDTLLKGLNVDSVDGILFDLGVSSFQLQNAERGFSFQSEGPLDMRLDRNSYICAYDLINNLNEEEISSLLWSFGQERWHNRIAHNLVMERQRHPISSTLELSRIVVNAIPPRYRQYHYRIHPATRTFQAVRIAVNRELEALESAIIKSIGLLKKGGRICIISFHSLEDRVVKHTFRKYQTEGTIKIITTKPLTPGSAETQDNPRSRSAKFRVAEKV